MPSGGAREGSGRKRGKLWIKTGHTMSKRIKAMLLIEPENREWLRERAKARGISQSDLINELITKAKI